jgi:hypothetical protein
VDHDLDERPEATLAGLVRRRAAESAIFLDDGDQPDATPQRVEVAKPMRPGSPVDHCPVRRVWSRLAATVPVIDETATLVQGFLGVLLPSGAVWPMVGMLVVTVVAMLWRWFSYARQTVWAGGPERIRAQ